MRWSISLLFGFMVSACSFQELLDERQSSSGGATGNTGGTSWGASASSGGNAENGGGLPRSSGCGLSAPRGVRNRGLDVRGVKRSFVLSVPDDYDPVRPYPLIFAWHGQAGDGALARRYFGVEEAASGRAIFVYPDGLPREAADGDTAWNLSPTGDDVALFDALLGAIYSEYCVDGARIFSTGHSYGAYMTNRLACSRANVLRAVASVAGGPPFGPGRDAACTGEVAALLVHGQVDSDVEVEEGIDARDRFRRANGCATTTHSVRFAPCVSYDGCGQDHPVLWCLHPGDHDWPSFAGATIWAFLAEPE